MCEITTFYVKKKKIQIFTLKKPSLFAFTLFKLGGALLSCNQVDNTFNLLNPKTSLS